MKLKIILEVVPPAGECKYPMPEDKPSPEQQVKDAIDCIESGHDSHFEWKFLNKVYNDLRSMTGKKKTSQVKNLISMIEPVLSKYGQMGVGEKDE